MESDGNSQIIRLLDASMSNDSDPKPHIFDGTPKETEGYGSIRVLVLASRPGILYMKQSMDCSYWDVVDEHNYPGTEVSLNEGLFQSIPVKSKWYKTEFHNEHSGPNDIRLQTMLHQDSVISASDVVIINNEPIPVTISGFEIPPISVSFPEISLGDVNVEFPEYMSVSLMHQPIDVNVDFPDFFSVSLMHQPIDVNVVNNTPVEAETAGITEVWESEEIEESTLIHDGALRLHTVHGTNFAPDYRFLKLYDIVGTIDPTIHKPRLTMPLSADKPHDRVFGERGLIFYNGLQVRVTRLAKPSDTELATAGDILASITYILE